MHKLFFYILFLFVVLPTHAQNNTKEMANGNQNYHARKYAQAEQQYRQAKVGSINHAQSNYNAGNAIYRQYQTDESVGHYQKALKSATTKKEKHQILHNLGNAFMKQKDYQQAVDAYKNALRNNPYDDETRYNYALAKKMLKENQQENQDNQDKNDDKKDNQDDKKDQDQQNKDNQDQENKDNQDKKDNKDNQNEQNKDQQDQQKDKKENNKQQPKNPQEQKQEQQKQQMDNMLRALDNHEKEVRKRVREKDKENAQPVRKQSNKDW